MKWLVYAVLAIFVLTALVFYFKRTALYVSLKKKAKKSDLKLKTNFSFWFLFNFKKTADFSMTGNDKSYKVKILNVFKKCSEIHFFNSREYALCNYWSWREVTSQKPLAQRDITHRILTSINPENDENVIPIILLSSRKPLIKATKTIENEICEISFGDKIENTVFANLDYIEKL